MAQEDSMPERFDDEIEQVLNVILSMEPGVIEDPGYIDTILDAVDVYGLWKVEPGKARHVIADPRRWGNLTVAVRPTRKAYEHRGLRVPPDLEC